MRLVTNWRAVLARAWSVWLVMLAAAVNGAALYWSAFQGDLPPAWFFAGGIALNMLAALARIIDQGIGRDAQ